MKCHIFQKFPKIWQLIITIFWSQTKKIISFYILNFIIISAVSFSFRVVYQMGRAQRRPFVNFLTPWRQSVPAQNPTKRPHFGATPVRAYFPLNSNIKKQQIRYIKTYIRCRGNILFTLSVGTIHENRHLKMEFFDSKIFKKKQNFCRINLILKYLLKKNYRPWKPREKPVIFCFFSWLTTRIIQFSDMKI